MSRSQNLHRFITLAFLIFISIPSASAQSDRGAIAGTILDSSGATVQGAEITATGASTGVVYKTTSSDTGAYRFSDMQVGSYNITISAAGFKKSEQTGVQVQINTTSSLDITLQAGAVTDTVTVLADVPTLQTETSDIGTVVTERQIMELALGGQRHWPKPSAFA